MAFFRYKASTMTGEVVEGQMEADDRETVVRRLQSQGQIPIRAEEVSPSDGVGSAGARRRRGRMGRRQLGVLTLELATLLEAGLPLERALGVLSELADTQSMYDLVARLRSEVRGGSDLSDAMANEPAVFFPLYVNLVRAGEAGGALDVALARLSDFMERSRELRDAVVSALIYPALLAVLAVVAVMLIMALVVPGFAEMFANAGQELPASTQFLVSVGDFLAARWWLLALAAAGTVVYARYLWREPGARLSIDRMLLRLPLWGDFVRKLEVARFSRALGTLLNNGVPLLGALNVAREIVGNTAVGEAVKAVADEVREGQGMARPLRRRDVFPELACHMLQVGEETGQLDTMLMKLADIYDREVRATVSRLVTLLEPAIILGLGLVVGGIIVSILTAVLQLNELAF